jgi:hypothetical protein
MLTVPAILLVIACVMFLLAAINVSSRVNLLALGLLMFTASFLFRA